AARMRARQERGELALRALLHPGVEEQPRTSARYVEQADAVRPVPVDLGRPLALGDEQVLTTAAGARRGLCERRRADERGRRHGALGSAQTDASQKTIDAHSTRRRR